MQISQFLKKYLNVTYQTKAGYVLIIRICIILYQITFIENMPVKGYNNSSPTDHTYYGHLPHRHVGLRVGVIMQIYCFHYTMHFDQQTQTERHFIDINDSHYIIICHRNICIYIILYKMCIQVVGPLTQQTLLHFGLNTWHT